MKFSHVYVLYPNMVARLMDNATLAEVMQGKPVSDAEVAAIHGYPRRGDLDLALRAESSLLSLARRIIRACAPAVLPDAGASTLRC